MDPLERSGASIAAGLIERRETIAVAEGSTAGLISAALLGVPGASAYFLGGAVVYTAVARKGLLDIGMSEMRDIRAATEPYAALLANRVRERLGATWGLAEAGAAGPTGNRYGDPAGHSCIGVAGPLARTFTLRTNMNDRRSNMDEFTLRALAMFDEALRSAS